jgi:hypothetical protein
MSALGLERHDYGALRRQALANTYTHEFRRRAPFYATEADAIVGGWHMMRPDDDFFMPLEMGLVLTTKRDAEPFFEIWVSGPKFQCPRADHIGTKSAAVRLGAGLSCRRHGRARRRPSSGHPRLTADARKTWMAATSAAMTSVRRTLFQDPISARRSSG